MRHPPGYRAASRLYRHPCGVRSKQACLLFRRAAGCPHAQTEMWPNNRFHQQPHKLALQARALLGQRKNYTSDIRKCSSRFDLWLT